VSAILAVGAVVLRGESVLLVRRANSPREGLWTLPGGRVQPGETYAGALHRELHEETGLRVRPVQFLEAVDIPPFVVLDYLAEADLGDPEAGDDALEARFVALATLRDYGLTEAVGRVIDRARRR